MPVYEKILYFIESFAMLPLYALGVMVAVSLPIAILCIVAGAFGEGSEHSSLVIASCAVTAAIGLTGFLFVRSLWR